MRSVNVARALAAVLLPIVGCAGVQKAMDDLNKPAPKADVPNVNISVNSSRAFDGGTSTAEGGAPVTDGTCDKACEHYLECKLPKGIIHGDLYLDNILFRGEKVVGVLSIRDLVKMVAIRDRPDFLKRS